MGSISESVYASGLLVSNSEYQVYPEVAGTLIQWLVDDGDRVQAGQRMCIIENKNARLQNYSANLQAENARIANNESKIQDTRVQKCYGNSSS